MTRCCRPVMTSCTITSDARQAVSTRALSYIDCQWCWRSYLLRPTQTPHCLSNIPPRHTHRVCVNINTTVLLWLLWNIRCWNVHSDSVCSASAFGWTSGCSGVFILGATGMAILSSGGTQLILCFPIRSFITLAENFGSGGLILNFFFGGGGATVRGGISLGAAALAPWNRSWARHQ